MAKGPAANDEEVPVVPIPKRVSAIVSDYHTLKHRLHNRTTFTATSSNDQTWTIKLNGMHNAITSQTTPNLHQPMGTQIAETIYNYYRVISCNVRFTFISEFDVDLMVGYEINDHTTTRIEGSTSRPRAFAESKQTKSDILPKIGATSPRVYNVTYHYNPSHFDHHITEQGTSERWTPKSEDPPIVRNIHFRALTADGTNLNWTTAYHALYTDVEYLVQWREAATNIYSAVDTDQ